MDAAILYMLDDVHRRTFMGRSVIYVPSSRTITIRKDCLAVFRCMGSGGGGGVGRERANDTAPYRGANGGNGGTVALKVAPLKAGQSVVVQLGAGGVGLSSGGTTPLPGSDGGTTTITAPGVNIVIPGGRGGATPSTISDNPQNADPTGVDWFALGGMGGLDIGGGGSAALLAGVPAQKGGKGSSIVSVGRSGGGGGGAGVGGAGGNAAGLGSAINPGAGGGAGGSAWSSGNVHTPGANLGFVSGGGSVSCDPAHSLVLVDVSGGGGWAGVTDIDRRNGKPGGGGAGVAGTTTNGLEWAGHGGFGGGGGAGSAYAYNTTVYRARAGNGGPGGGGGALLSPNTTDLASGYGGPAFLTLELLEYVL